METDMQILSGFFFSEFYHWNLNLVLFIFLRTKLGYKLLGYTSSYIFGEILTQSHTFNEEDGLLRDLG